MRSPSTMHSSGRVPLTCEALEPRLLLNASGLADLLLGAPLITPFEPPDGVIVIESIDCCRLTTQLADPWSGEGDVGVQVVDGRLIVTGDQDSNGILIDQAGLRADQFRVSACEDSITTINGKAGPAIVSGVTCGVEIRLKGGDDLLDMSDISVTKDLFVSGGSGDDSIWLSSSKVSEDLIIRGGPGHDDVLLSDSTVTGNVKIDNGSGDSETDIENSTVGGSLTVHSKRGDDDFYLYDSEVLGDVTVTNGGGGWDLVDIDGSTIAGGLVVRSNTDFYLYDSGVHGNVVISNARSEWSETDIDGSSIGGGLAVRSNSSEGGDFYLYDSDVRGDVTVHHGGGESNLADIDGSTIGGTLAVKSQGEWDEFYLWDSEVQGDVKVRIGRGIWSEACVDILASALHGDLWIKSGRGDDAVEIAELELDGDLTIATGGGRDEIALKLRDDAGWEDVVLASFPEDGRSAGGSEETFLAASVVRGDLRIKSGGGGDLIDLLAVSLGGRLAVNAGRGDDCISINDSGFAGATVLKTGSGDDEIKFETELDVELEGGLPGPRAVTAFADRVLVRTGSGEDRITVGLTGRAGSSACFHGSVLFCGGGGIDVFNAGEDGNIGVAPENIRNIEIIGTGGGANSVNPGFRARGSNTFAFDLHETLRGKQGDLFF